MDSLVRAKHRKRDMRFGTWNITNLHRAGLLNMLARELGKYKVDVVGVQEVR
jgi:exonuclease III